MTDLCYICAKIAFGFPLKSSGSSVSAIFFWAYLTLRSESILFGLCSSCNFGTDTHAGRKYRVEGARKTRRNRSTHDAFGVKHPTCNQICDQIRTRLVGIQLLALLGKKWRRCILHGRRAFHDQGISSEQLDDRSAWFLHYLFSGNKTTSEFLSESQGYDD